MHHRIHVEAIATEVVIEGDEFHHAVRVARLRDGEEVELFDGRGGAAAGRVSAIGRQELRVVVLREIPSRELRVPLTLAMAVIQLEKFELVLQKATELGAAGIIPLATDRGEVRQERYRGKRERWEKIVLEAVKQSGRSVVPQLADPETVDQTLARSGAKIVFDADSEPVKSGSHSEPVILLVGPEGGWSERELELARQHGCGFQRLGPRRLRAETAAIVALATTAMRSGELV